MTNTTTSCEPTNHEFAAPPSTTARPPETRTIQPERTSVRRHGSPSTTADDAAGPIPSWIEPDAEPIDPHDPDNPGEPAAPSGPTEDPDEQPEPVTDPDGFEYEAVLAAARDSVGFADRDTSWDGDAARRSLQSWARGNNGEIDWSKYGRGFLYVAPAGDGGHKLADFKLPFAKVVNGRLVAVLAGVQAAAAAVSGARGGVDLPSSAVGGVKRKINTLYARARSQFDDEEIVSPFESDSQQAAGTLAAVTADAGQADLVQLATPDGQPWRPPGDWFADPQLDEYTRLTVTPEGRVYGHLADWRAKHISYQGRDVPVPRSKTNYSWFHRRAVETDNGDTVRVGQLTFGPGHADPNGGYQAAAHHYDATSAQGAVVHAGEDRHGIWIAGAILPHLSVPEANTLALADVSGDWRHDGRGLELVAAHCVGVPGFLSSRTDAGEMLAMAADAHHTDDDPDPVVCLDDSGAVATLIASATSLTRAGKLGDAEAQVCHASISVSDLTSQVAEAVVTRLAASDPPQQTSDEVCAPKPEPEGGEDVGGTETRIRAARARMAAVRAAGMRRPTADNTEDPECAAALTASIDALIETMDSADPDVRHARVLAARIRHGSRGSLVAASSASLDRRPGSNWVEDDSQGLPPLVRRVARHIERNGRPLSVAIPAAINWVKHVCSTGDVENFPGLQRVNPVSRAAACRAVAQWNALKARN